MIRRATGQGCSLCGLRFVNECNRDLSTVNAVGSATGPNIGLNYSFCRIGDDIHCVEVVVGQPGGYLQPEVVLHCLRRLAYAAA